MNQEYWHQKWQTKEIGFNQSQPNKLLQRYFASLKLKPQSRVFVPLCGKSVDMLWLASQGYQVIGVELSPIACNAFFTENQIPVKITKLNDFTLYHGGEISIFAGDFFKLTQSLLKEIDAVYDRAALIALPLSTRKDYAKHLLELMIPSSVMLLITTAYNQNDMQGPPFSVDENEVISLYGTHFTIHQLYSKQFEIPEHLQAKGLQRATEKAYALLR